MSDRILIKDLLLRTIVGINDDEQNQRQDVLLQITLETDTRPAGRSDSIEETVNYRTVTKRIIELVEGNRFALIERLAEVVARSCLEDERVRRVHVTAEKPGALRFARTVGVSISRTRSDF